MEQEVAGVESFGLKAWTVAWDEKPMANLVAEQLDGAERRELAAKFRICGIGAVGKNKPDTIVPWRFVVIAEHADDAVGNVDGKTREHAAYFGVERGERVEDKCVRWGLFSFGRARHDCSGWKIADLVRTGLGWRGVAELFYDALLAIPCPKSEGHVVPGPTIVEAK